MAGTFAHGTVLTLGAVIANLTSINGPSASADTIDVTTHDSPDGYREFIGGLRDGGEVAIEGYVSTLAEITALTDLLDSGEVTTGSTIDFPTDPGVTATFGSIVTAFEPSAPHDGAIGFSATLKVTGKPVFAATA